MTGYWKKDFLYEAVLEGDEAARLMADMASAESDPAIMMGKPVVTGTRVTVELIREKLAAGETVEQILEAHPRLTRGSIQAALAFAAEALRADVVYPLPEAV